MTIFFAEHDDVLTIAQNMRDADSREIYNVRHRLVASPENIANDVMMIKSVGGMAFVAKNADGEPVSCFGASENWRGVWTVYMFATDKFPEVSLAVTRFIKRNMIPLIKSLGAHRAECMSAMSHTVAHRWLTALGAEAESVKVRYGSNGEDYLCFRWIDEV